MKKTNCLFVKCCISLLVMFLAASCSRESEIDKLIKSTGYGPYTSSDGNVYVWSDLVGIGISATTMEYNSHIRFLVSRVDTDDECLFTEYNNSEHSDEITIKYQPVVEDCVYKIQVMYFSEDWAKNEISEPVYIKAYSGAYDYAYKKTDIVNFNPNTKEMQIKCVSGIRGDSDNFIEDLNLKYRVLVTVQDTGKTLQLTNNSNYEISKSGVLTVKINDADYNIIKGKELWLECIGQTEQFVRSNDNTYLELTAQFFESIHENNYPVFE